MQDDIRIFARLERKLRSKVGSMVKRAVFGSFQQNTFLTAQTSTLKDETRDQVEVFEQYGFTSQPPSGSEGVVLAVNGDSSHLIGLAVGSRGNRVQTLQTGETCVYSQHGSTITLMTNGDIVLTPGPGTVVRLGGQSATLAVARATDPVSPSTALITWAGIIETAINALAPGTFTPLNGFTGAVQADFASIQTGGQGSTST